MSELMLTIYPRQPRTPGPGTGWADWRRDQDRECRMAHDKRFSDAELAAEWHAVDAEYAANFWDDIAPAILGPMRGTLHRFATAPHYYEETE